MTLNYELRNQKLRFLHCVNIKRGSAENIQVSFKHYFLQLKMNIITVILKAFRLKKNSPALELESPENEISRRGSLISK